MTSGEATLFLVDDDPGVLTALARVLQGEGWRVESYASAEAFLARPDPAAWGCVVLDVDLPGLDGLEVQQRLAETGQFLPIVFLTGKGDVPMSVRAIKAGAADFLIKPVPAAVLIAAVRAALQQGKAARDAQVGIAELQRRLAGLSPREREVLEGVAAGKLNKQIAADLGIVEQTVKFHRARIMERMQAGTVAELMFVAAKLGIGPRAAGAPNPPPAR